MNTAYENLYGATADKYATKYGVNTSDFRKLISDVSGFNPYQVNADGSSGIGGMVIGKQGVNPFDAETGLDYAAQYFGSLLKSGKSVEEATAIYKNEISDKPGETAGMAPVKDAQGDTSQPLWKWGTVEWKKFFTSSFFGLLIGFVGVVFIIGSIYALIMKSKISLPK